MQRLGLAQIDPLHIHNIDPAHHAPDQLEHLFRQCMDDGYHALEKLRSEGVIKGIGRTVSSGHVRKVRGRGGFRLHDDRRAISIRSISPLWPGSFRNAREACGAGGRPVRLGSSKQRTIRRSRCTCTANPRQRCVESVARNRGYLRLLRRIQGARALHSFHCCIRWSPAWCRA